MIGEISGKILSALNEVTGTRGVRNLEDISIIFRYSTAYSMTCKEIYAACTSATAVTLFLESLAARFGNSPEYYAPLWNTKGSREYLIDFLKRENHVEIYKKMQSIKKIAVIESQELFHSETCSKNGIFLQIAETAIRVISPFGTIIIMEDSEWHDEEDVMLSGQFFIKKLQATFVMTLKCPVLGNTDIYSVATHSACDCNQMKLQENPPFNRKGLKRVWSALETIEKGGDPIATPFSIRRRRKITPPSFMRQIAHFGDWAYQILTSFYVQKGRQQKIFINSLDAEIWEKMSKGATHFANNGEQSIYANYDKENLTLTLQSKIHYSQFLEMEELYKKVIANLGVGWVLVTLTDYSEIRLRKSEETHFIFVKKDGYFNEEADLFNLIASQLGVGDWILCNNLWDGIRDTFPPYLWIEKDYFEKVRDTMGLTI